MATWVLAGALLVGLREPRPEAEGARSLLGDTLEGLLPAPQPDPAPAGPRARSTRSRGAPSASGGLVGNLVTVAMFGLRVRSIERARFGRAIAISMMLNSLGFPIGAGLGGQLAVRSVSAALVFACLVPLLAAGLSAWLLRPASQAEPAAVLTPKRATSEP